MNLAMSTGCLALAIVFTIGGTSATLARNYDCSKPGNANKAACKAALTDSTSATTTSAQAPARAPAATPTAALAGYTAQCKDGSTWSGKLKFAACAGHKGVQSWTGAAPVAEQGSLTKQAPIAAPAIKPAPQAVGGAGQVWVNTKSKVYHCPGDAYYGKTKQGQYMTEAAAVAAGAHADNGKACH